MIYMPDFDRFTQLASGTDFVPVYRQLVSDVVTPVQAFQRLDSTTAACLFESVIGGEKVGRYSFLASDPFLWIKAYGNQVTVATLTRPSDKNSAAKPSWATQSFESANPFDTLRDHVHQMNVAHLPELPPFIGGAVAGLPGALIATPLFGAIKQLYFEFRFGLDGRPGSKRRREGPVRRLMNRLRRRRPAHES